MKLNQTKYGVYALIASTLLGACGGARSTTSAGAEVELTGGLASLPSMSSMLVANINASALNVASYSPQAVSGTAPLLKSLAAANVDTYFFDGALANLTSWAANASNLSSAQKLTTANNYRGVNGAAGGQGACRMAQETGSVFDRMLSNGTSACYMRKMPGATGAPADTFAQTAEDKLVRVHVSNMTDHGGGGGGGGPTEMYVNIKVAGSNTTGAGVYKATLFFCQGTTGAPDTTNQGVESFEFNKATGIFKAGHASSRDFSEATAYLKKDGDTITIDPSKDRGATFANSDGGYAYKSEVTLTGDNKVYNKAYGTGNWGSNRNYSVASFTGASMADLRFTAGAFKGRGDSTGCTYFNGTSNVPCDPWTYEGGTEFQDTHYVSTNSSSLYSELSSVNLQTDTFYADPSLTAPDVTSFDCGATPTSTLEMDFSTSVVKEVQATCEGDRLFDSEDSWQMCEGGRSHEQLIWEYSFEHP